MHYHNTTSAAKTNTVSTAEVLAQYKIENGFRVTRYRVMNYFAIFLATMTIQCLD